MTSPDEITKTLKWAADVLEKVLQCRHQFQFESGVGNPECWHCGVKYYDTVPKLSTLDAEVGK